MFGHCYVGTVGAGTYVYLCGLKMCPRDTVFTITVKADHANADPGGSGPATLITTTFSTLF